MKSKFEAMSRQELRAYILGNREFKAKVNKRSPMINTYTAIIKQDGDWWIGWIEEIPGVNCQEASRHELLESLRITLREALEFNKQEAINAASGKYQEEKIVV